MSQIDSSLGQAHLFCSRIRRGCEGEHAVVGQTNILARNDDHPSSDVKRIFSGLDHAREVVQSRVGVGATNGFVKIQSLMLDTIGEYLEEKESLQDTVSLELLRSVKRDY